MAHIKVTDALGDIHILDAVEGWRVMEILRDRGVGVDGSCGGQCVCGTCHVYVDEAWLARLHPARDEEEDKLDELPGMSGNSRLSCQLIWDESLDGLHLIIAGD